MSNRIRSLRQLYGFIRRLQTDSGLARNKDGTVNATDKWWEDNTQGKPEWRKCQYGYPVFTRQMEILFHNVAVDGSTAFVPVQQEHQGEGTPVEHEEREEDREEREEEREEEDNDCFSPMSTSNSRKRGRSTSSTAKSPEQPEKRTKALQKALSSLKREQKLQWLRPSSSSAVIPPNMLREEMICWKLLSTRNLS